MAKYRSVLITGASSGIGAALARACAGPDVTLHLGGRDPERLAAVAAACEAKGARVIARVQDVRDAAAMAAWIAEAGPLDLVVANAGISAGPGRDALERSDQIRAIFAVNLDGMLNTVLPAMAAMVGQGVDASGVRGRIAVIASVAGFVAAPGSPSYCASKAAADAWTIGTAHGARKLGIVLCSVCPGYVRTAMTADNPFPMPGLMSADRAADIILGGIGAERRRITFPWWIALAARLTGLLPPRWSATILSRPPAKPSWANSL